MKYLFLLRGAPGSGKSRFVTINDYQEYTINPDTIRLMYSGIKHGFDTWEYISQDDNKKVWKIVDEALENRMRHGQLTFLDATNVDKKTIDKYRNLCKQYFYSLVVIDFTKVDLETCLFRNKKRDSFRYVPESVIKDMWERSQEPLSKSIRVIDPDDIESFIATRYNYLDFGEYDKTIIIGDVHGCYTALQDLITKVTGYSIEAEENKKNAFVFIGDYFDRGKEIDKMFLLMQQIYKQDNVYCLWGNHELHLRDWLIERKIGRSAQRTVDILQSMNVNKKQIRSFLNNLLTGLWFRIDHCWYNVTHAGMAYKPMTTQLPWIEDDYFIQGAGGFDHTMDCVDRFSNSMGDIQIFGHRNNENMPTKVDDKNYNVCDTVEHGGSLRCVIIDKNNVITTDSVVNTIVDSNEIYTAYIKNSDMIKKNLTAQDHIDLYRKSPYVKENNFGSISSFNFTKDAFQDEKWDSITTKARGMYVNKDINKIVARSYDKFFLVGQRFETQKEVIADQFEFPVYVYQKYDGFLGILGYDETIDDFVIASKSVMSGALNYESSYADHLR
jgi:predicted kinase/predicted MPP superfamily phosphohydrolase